MVWSNKHHRLVLPHSSQLCSLTLLGTDLKPLLLSSNFFLGKMVKYYILKIPIWWYMLNGHLRTIKVRLVPVAKSLQSCLTLCDPTDCSPPGSSVHGSLQARPLKWTFPSPGDLSDPGTNKHLLCLLHCRQILHHWAIWEAYKIRFAKAEYDNYS